MNDDARRERLRNQAKAVLDKNYRQGVSPWENRRYSYTCPSPHSYPFQWFWDSCFHAIALTHFDLDRAKNELRSLLQGAQPDGFIPHIIFWQPDEKVMANQTLRLRTPYLSASIQPPPRNSTASAWDGRRCASSERWARLSREAVNQGANWNSRAPSLAAERRGSRPER